jgi:hypothetical protein
VNANISDSDNGNSNNDNDNDDDQDRVLSKYKLELVLRKWFAIDPSREMRAFVREGVLIGALFVSFRFVSFRFFSSSMIIIYIYILFSLCERTGISQRGDTNYYEFLNEPGTQRKIVSSFVAYWTTHVKPKWTGPTSCKSLHRSHSPLFSVFVVCVMSDR